MFNEDYYFNRVTNFITYIGNLKGMLIYKKMIDKKIFLYGTRIFKNTSYFTRPDCEINYFK